MKVNCRRSTVIVFFLLVHVNSFLDVSDSSPEQCSAWLVQTIPTDMPHLPRISGVLSTADVFRWLAGNSSRTLDITSQYWQLRAQPENPLSGDYGYSKGDLQKFGAQEGYNVYKALENAADHNVSVRLLSHSGRYPYYTSEPTDLASGRPNVKNVTLLLSEWWDVGLVHAKIWISDTRDIYIGSANNEWRSLTQVNELGIYLVGCPRIAKQVEAYFDNLWMLASLNSSAFTEIVADQQWQIERKVPCWSRFLDSEVRCRSPLPPFIETPNVAGYPRLSEPSMFKLPIQTPGCKYSNLEPQSSYLSFAPPELLFGSFQADEQAWVDTIKSVGRGGTVRISTMDWLAQSQYTNQTIYWSTLSSAVSEVVFGKQATVKILVAYWAHLFNNADEYLNSLLYSNVLCSSSKRNKCSGKVEIKYYIVPGFNMTGPAMTNEAKTGNLYPAHSRFYHAKYAVSDVRAHIGSSNIIWDHFYSTADVSFGIYDPAIVAQLQEIFEADWNSPYAVPVEEVVDGLFYYGCGSSMSVNYGCKLNSA